MLVALVVNTSAMHIFKVSSMVLTFMTAFFSFSIFKVTIIKTTSFWFYLKLNIKNPTHLVLILPPSLCTCPLSLSLSNTDFPNPRFPETPKNPQFHNHLSLSLSFFLSLCVLGALSNLVSVCVLGALSFLLKFRNPTTVRFLIWRKASSIYLTISSHLSRSITPGPPKVLPTTTTSPRSSRSLLHSFAFNVYRCFFFFFYFSICVRI